MIPIILPIYDRPEFLRECLDSLRNCQGIETCKIYAYIDKHRPYMIDECKMLLKHFHACDVDIVERDERLGGSKNILTAIKETLEKTTHDWMICLESDIVVSNQYIKYMTELCERFKNNPNVYQVNADTRKFSGDNPDITKIETFEWPSSLGQAFFTNKMDWFLSHADEYIKSPPDFAKKHLHEVSDEVPAKGKLTHPVTGKFFNNAWGGLMAFNLAMFDYTTIRPHSHSQVCHIGWHGWHSEKPDLDELDKLNRKFGNYDHTHTPDFFQIEYDNFQIDFHNINGTYNLSKKLVTT